MGLTDDAWPLPARPNPFVPIALQRAAGVPQADPSSSLELDRRITQGWTQAAGEVAFSHSKMRGESELSPSPLIAAVPLANLEDLAIAPAASLRDAIRRAGSIEALDDSRGPPPLLAGTISGGTGLFRDQAACPFRAFAKHRLGCRDAPESPKPGLNPMDRGTIVHAMLAELWRSLEHKARLDDSTAEELRPIVTASVEKAIESVKRFRPDVLGGVFGRLERERLARIAHEWLTLERGRSADFDVVAIEEKQPAMFGGVTVNVKLDRLDDVAGLGRFVIDYKTGEASPSGLMVPRLDEPQLPMYALSHENVAGVAFAQVRTGDMEFRGIAKADKVARGVEQVGKGSTKVAKFYSTWPEAMARLKSDLESTGRAFASGDARVDPKRGVDTCKQCEQQPFCRIAEKSAYGAVKKAEEDD
jgi:probable DNA repair protein